MEIAEFTNKIVPMRTELLEIAVRITGNDNLAEDLTQEVMLKLWSMRDGLDLHGNRKALAITILRNKYNDYLRHRKFEKDARSATKDIQTEQISFETKDEVALIKEIVEHLPPLQSLIFRMKEIDGYDKEEIIKITGCSPESLRQNLSRARRRIREEFMKRTKG